MVDILSSLNLFDKLVVEHGGSVIFKNHISLLKEQMLILDSEKKDIQIANKELQLRINDLEKEVRIANERSDHLQKILDEVHSITLNENHEKVLVAVASYSGQHSAVLANTTGLSEAETTAKLNYLSSLNLLHFQHGMLTDTSNPKPSHKSVSLWFVSKTRRAYVKAHNLNIKIA